MKTDLPKEKRNQHVDEGAELLGIKELLDRSPSELSGGQQQRVKHHGDRDAVHFVADGKEYTAVTPQNQFESPDQEISVSFGRDDFWLFDADGERLL